MAKWQYRIRVDSTAARLKSAGPLIPGAWSRHDDELGRRMPGEFLIDTGAYGAMIDLDVAASLQLSSSGAQEVHGIHGYGSLQKFLAKLLLPAQDFHGQNSFFESIVECVAVPSLLEKNREHGADVIGILGRAFLQTVSLNINGGTGEIELLIGEQPGGRMSSEN